MFGLNWNSIFRTLRPFLKRRLDREAMKLYEELMSAQTQIPSCLFFSPSHSDDRRFYERLVEKGLLERSEEFVGNYQIVGRGGYPMIEDSI